MSHLPRHPSPPASPTEEQDISRAGVYNEESRRSLQKGKQRAEDPFDEDETTVSGGEERYPPLNDEETESRRVAEVRRPQPSHAEPGFTQHTPRTCVAGRRTNDNDGRSHASRVRRRWAADPSSATSRGEPVCSGRAAGRSSLRRQGPARTISYTRRKTSSHLTT